MKLIKSQYRCVPETAGSLGMELMDVSSLGLGSIMEETYEYIISSLALHKPSTTQVLYISN